MRKTLLLFITVLSTLFSIAQPHGQAGEYTKVTSEMNTLPSITGYIEYLPEGYDGIKEFPLVISFSGTGEGGEGTATSLNKVFNNSPIERVEVSGVKYDAIIICPQGAGQNYLDPEQCFLMFAEIILKYRVDLNRVYGMGFSAGGKNLWQFADTYPDLFAAIIPICGAGKVTNRAPYLRTLPCWSHHNHGDNTVSYESFTTTNFIYISDGLNPTAANSRGIYPYSDFSTKSVADDDYTMHMTFTVENGDTLMDMFSEKGVIEPHQFHSYTLYKNGGHDAWHKTFENNDVWTWLFKQSKNGPITASKNNVTTKTLELYPNPVSADNLTITLGNGFDAPINSVELLNTKGELVTSTNKITDSLITFPTKNVKSGVYVIKIITDVDSITKRIIIQ